MWHCHDWHVIFLDVKWLTPDIFHMMWHCHDWHPIFIPCHGAILLWLTHVILSNEVTLIWLTFRTPWRDGTLSWLTPDIFLHGMILTWLRLVILSNEVTLTWQGPEILSRRVTLTRLDLRRACGCALLRMSEHAMPCHAVQCYLLSLLHMINTPGKNDGKEQALKTYSHLLRHTHCSLRRTRFRKEWEEGG